MLVLDISTLVQVEGLVVHVSTIVPDLVRGIAFLLIVIFDFQFKCVSFIKKLSKHFFY